MATAPLDIEILRPADTLINPAIHKVLIFMVPELKTMVQLTEGKKYFSNPVVLKDLENINFHTMANLLSGSPRFSLMEPAQTPGPDSGNTYSWEEIDSICAKGQVNACLILSRQELEMGIKKQLIVYDEGGYSAQGFIWFTASWKFYDPANRMIISKDMRTGKEIRGDIVDFPQEALQAMPDFEELAATYATEAGEKYASWLAPIWEHDTRNYYEFGNNEMESVRELIEQGKMKQAFSIWRKYASSNKTILAKHASFNTIISYEVEGKLDSALYWANKYYQRFKTEESLNYSILLQDRIREKEVIRRQLGVK